MNEDEYAIRYAEERLMRLALETRLNGLLYELVPYLSAANTMCQSIVTQQSDDLASAISCITDWQGDLETNVLLNLFKPAGKFEGVKQSDVANCTSLGDLPDVELNRMEQTTRAAAKETRKQWNKLAAEHGYATQEEFCMNHKRNLVEMTLNALMKRKDNTKVKAKT